MPIVLQFCSFPTLVGEVIDWFTAGEVGHVDAVLPDGSLLGAQQQAGLGGAGAGVQVRPAGYGNMQHIRRVSLSAEPAQEQQFWMFLRAQLGKPYDITAFAAFAAGRDWQEPDSWFCSELIAAGLEAGRVFAYPLAAPANKITPQELFLLCSAFGPVSTPA